MVQDGEKKNWDGSLFIYKGNGKSGVGDWKGNKWNNLNMLQFLLGR